MNKIITAVEKKIGPKIAAVAAAGTTAVGQISSALGVSGNELDVIDIVVNAAQSDLVSFLPAPIAGVLAYFMRKAPAPEVEESTSYLAIDYEHRFKRMEIIVEQIDQSHAHMDDEVTSLEATVDVLIDRMEAFEDARQQEIEAQPLNLRQNNPGNIESTLPGGNRWNGEQTSTNRYAVFESPAYGLRAMMYLLRKVYFQRHGLVSVESIIHRWAPLGDNSPESVANYIDHVAKDLRVQSVAKLTMDNEQLTAMVKSMAEFEGGRPLPYDKEVYTEALELLG